MYDSIHISEIFGRNNIVRIPIYTHRYYIYIPIDFTKSHFFPPLLPNSSNKPPTERLKNGTQISIEVYHMSAFSPVEGNRNEAQVHTYTFDCSNEYWTCRWVPSVSVQPI